MDTLLHDRTNSGFKVELHRRGSMVWITGETEQHSAWCVVPAERALEAFLHPCCFLPTPNLFFDRRTGEVEVEVTGDDVASMQAVSPSESETFGHSEAVGSSYCELCENFLAGNEFRVCTSCRENGS